MTTTLEAHHRGAVHLRVLSRSRRGMRYRRRVVLALDGSERPVEYGEIVIHLDALPSVARRHVLAARRPLGAILRRFRVRYASRPTAFFRIRAGAPIRRALGLACPCTLWGRCNALRGADGRAIAEIVEILPPA
jgi:chorismate-pyruvate lyase